MKVFIFPNFKKEKTSHVLPQLIKILSANGDTVLLEHEVADRFGGVGVSMAQGMKTCDYVISVGGDGTIIHAAKKAAVYGKAVLGINCGRLGYLSGLEWDDLNRLDEIGKGHYRMEERAMMNVVFVSKDKEYHKDFLNDVVLSKGALSHMVDLEVGIADSKIGYRADGVIVATPTGSTAYSMSAGGPLVAPGVDVLTVTPISAHSFYNRSIVAGTEDEIVLTNRTDSDNEVYLSIDGEKAYLIRENETVKVKKSNRVARLMKLDNRSFFETVAKKLQ